MLWILNQKRICMFFNIVKWIWGKYLYMCWRSNTKIIEKCYLIWIISKKYETKQEMKLFESRSKKKEKPTLWFYSSFLLFDSYDSSTKKSLIQIMYAKPKPKICYLCLIRVKHFMIRIKPTWFESWIIVIRITQKEENISFQKCVWFESRYMWLKPNFIEEISSYFVSLIWTI